MRWIGKILAGIVILFSTTYIIFVLFINVSYGFPHGSTLNQMYKEWVMAAIRGDFGFIYGPGEPIPVLEELSLPILNTLLLNGTAFIVSIIISIPIGVISATRNSSFSKYFVMFLTAVATAVPAYIIGLFLIYNLTKFIPGLPINGMRSLIFRVKGYDNIWQEIADIANHMLLPVFSMSVVMVGTFVPYIRNSLMDVLHQDYIRTARAKGLKQRVVLFKHAFKNAILPFISVTSMLLPGLIMSNIFVETVFIWPGIGMRFIQALYQNQLYIVVTIVLFYTILTLISSFVADIISTRMDPRVKEDFAK